MIFIRQPAWFLMLIPLLAGLLMLRLPGKWLTGLRTAVVITVVLAMAGLSIKLPTRTGTVVVVADRSRSMPVDSAEHQKEIIDLLVQHMPGGDRLGVVSVGAQGVIEHLPQSGPFPAFVNAVDADGSNLDEGIQTAVSLIPSGTSGRILVLSDGRWTGQNPGQASTQAALRGIPIDFRLQERPRTADVAVHQIIAPKAVDAGSAFMIGAWLDLPRAGQVRYRLQNENGVVAEGNKFLGAGFNRLLFRDRAKDAGIRAYELTVSGAAPDAVPENNHARVLVNVRGNRPLLVATPTERAEFSRLLQEGGLEVVTRRPGNCTWTLEEISGYEAVILENVPAQKLGNQAMGNLAAWVRDAGGGLFMTGGRNAYGPGGYFKSPLDPLMPVSMELREEHRKLALAIVAVLDRSGSMAAPAGSGRTKMDLANLGAAEVVNLLTAMDEVGVIAVDSTPHTIVPLQALQDKESVRRKILTIDSMGGGIFVYDGLTAAVRMLTSSQVGTRHIILFADAADAEQPGQYQELLRQCGKANITVSVIGLGSPSDVDAPFLQDVAKRGDGRSLFTDNPHDIPRLFAQDTFAVARSTFVEEPVGVKVLPGLLTLSGRAFPDSFGMGGYNLCYLRPGAEVGALTTDEYNAPVVAAWHADAGRVACYTGEVDGQFTGKFADWPEAGELLTSLARWTAGKDNPLPAGMLITQSVENGSLQVTLHLDPDRDEEPFTGVPQVFLLRQHPDREPSRSVASMRWMNADTLEFIAPLHHADTVLAVVEVPGYDRVSLAPVCLPYSPEFSPENSGKGRSTLGNLAAATGGTERGDLAAAWDELPKVPQFIELTPWLALAAAALFLVEVLQRRTGILGRRRSRSQVATEPEQAGAELAAAGRARQRPQVKPNSAKAGRDSRPHPATPKNKPGNAPATPAEDGLSALDEARRRARRRTGN